MKKTIFAFTLCSLMALPSLHAQENYVSKVWVADQGNGTYKNPVLYADYSDPDVCRVGEDYYLTSSSFNCIPGLQVLHSKDLVNWSIVGAALPYAVPPVDDERPEHTETACGLRVSAITTVNSIYSGATPTKVHS